MYENFTIQQLKNLNEFGMACPCYGDGLWFETMYDE